MNHAGRQAATLRRTVWRLLEQGTASTSRRWSSSTSGRKRNGPPITAFSTKASEQHRQHQRLLDELGIADSLNTAKYSHNLLHGEDRLSSRGGGGVGGRRRRRRRQQDFETLVASARHRQQQQTPQQQNRRVFPVSAMHLGQTIDLDEAVKTHVFVSSARAPPSIVANRVADPLQRLFGKNSIVIELPHLSSSSSSLNKNPSRVEQQDPAPPPPPSPKYLALFRFGSIVGINLSPQEFQQYTNDVRSHVIDPVKQGSERTEEFGIVLEPQQRRWLQHQEYEHQVINGMSRKRTPSPSPPIVTGDHCVVSELDLNGVAVISTIMAQTVALDTYNDTVDNLLDKFAAINSSVRASGTFKSSDKGFMFKSVAHNNAIFIDMISKIRLKDRSDMAWNNTHYAEIHDGLREEFEIEDRFEQIEYKLNLIQQNSKFFLEVLESEKTYSLEWIIVLLISVECVLMCFEMSGLGEQFFASLGSKLAPVKKLIWGH